MIFLILNGLYILFLLWLLSGNRLTPGYHPGSGKMPAVTVSVVVAVRNEAEHILHLLAGLNCQTYPHFEVIIADDFSTDETLFLLRDFARTADFPLTILEMSDLLPVDFSGNSFKKQALTAAIAQARGELILTTDGDCRVGERWIETFVRYYTQTQAACLTGAVCFEGEPSVFEKIQAVELASLMGAGAGTLAYHFPTLANGANLAFPKRVFEEVNGYTASVETASGDDVLLVQKISRAYPGRVRFVKSREATVQTNAVADWRGFWQQRLRWAGKWRHFQDGWLKGLAFFVFTAHASLLITFFLCFLQVFEWKLWLWQTGIRWAAEAVFLAVWLNFLRKPGLLFFIPLTQILYPFYTVILGITATFRKHYQWKDRKVEVVVDV
jgi:cellulose synthase/poly-beta-1,6-N-acetylglucosamine synthase-like glycosyltransferase